MTKNPVSYPSLNEDGVWLLQRPIFLQLVRCFQPRWKVQLPLGLNPNLHLWFRLIQSNPESRFRDEPCGVARFFHPLMPDQTSCQCRHQLRHLVALVQAQVRHFPVHPQLFLLRLPRSLQ